MKFISLVFTSVLLTVSCNSQHAEYVLKPAVFNQKINSTPQAVVLDVRTPEEVAGGFISNAINIDYNGDNFKDEIGKLDKSKSYFVYCLSGKRSGAAMDYMQGIGFKNVYNLEGGILAWQNNNFPVTTTSTPQADKIPFDAYMQMITSDTAVLVDYFAPWCAPCIKMKPMLEGIAKEYACKVKVVRIDINDNKALAKKLNIVEIPILKIFIKGKETWSHHGYIEKADLVKQL